MHTRRQNVLAGLTLGSAGVPIYVQLRDQLLHAIGDGVLAAGAQMPTMRQVAVALRVDLNTVRHAYDELERLGVVTLIRGRGSFVTAAPLATDEGTVRTRLEDFARRTLAEARTLGIDPEMLCQCIAALAAENGERQ